MSHPGGLPDRWVTREVHIVVPEGIDDPDRPSGGNTYDRRACSGLRAIGWSVHEHAVPGRWPDVDPAARAALAGLLSRMPSGALVLIDGLVASVVPDLLGPETGRLRLVVLLHMPRADAREAAALSSASAIVATSQWTSRWLAEAYDVPPERVHVVPPGVDPAEPASGTASGGRLLCVGAVTAIKGHDVLLEALSMVDGPAWRCVCAGALDVDSEFAAAVLQQCRTSGLDGRVRFRGALTPADLRGAYAQADVLVLASRSETYGMVVTEALARGLPVIATNVGGVAEALGHAADGSTPGLLVPPHDPAALAVALRRWLADPAERERLRASARSRRTMLLDWARTAQGLSDVLTEVAGRRMNHPRVSAV